MLDLQQFCGKEETRPYLLKPFSVGDFTYATNGHIMVRVTRRDDAAEQTKEWDWNAPLAGLQGASFAKPEFKLPPEPEEADECSACDGRGTEHDCPDCECPCVECDGTGKDIPERGISTEFCGANFAMRYIRQVLSLPNVELASITSDAPMVFRFDGGVGALMPLRSPGRQQVEVFKTAVSSQEGTK